MKRTTVLVPMNIKAKAIVFVTCLLSTAFSGSAPEQQLVAHWSFDSSNSNSVFYDVTGNGYDATCSQQLSIIPGVKGNALESKVSGYTFQVANSLGNFNAPYFTVASWVYTNVAPNTYPGQDMHQLIISNQSYNTSAVAAAGYEIDVSTTGAVSFKMATSVSGWVNCISKSVLAAKQWYHVVGTYDGDSMKIYINGNRDISIFQPADFIQPIQNAMIGYQAEYPGGPARNWFNGRLDELLLFNAALDAAAVAELFASYDFSTLPVSTPKLLAHWSFDSTDNATSFFDVSGNGHTAKTNQFLLTDGVRGAALDCNSDNFEVRVPNSAPDFVVDQFTIESWIYSYIDLSNPGSFYNYKGIFNFARVGMEGSGYAGGYSIQISDKGKLFSSMSLPESGGWIAAEAQEVLKPRTWYHIAATYDKKTLRLFVNGAQVSQVAAPNGFFMPANTPAAAIGAQFQITDQSTDEGRIRTRFNGKIDELKLYNYALDAQVLKATYEALKPAVKPPFEINIGMKTTYAQPGDTVIMPVYIANHEEYAISALQLSLKYDPSKLTLLSISKDSGIVKTFELFDWNNTTPGSVPVAMAGTTVRLGYGEGELFRCVFVVASSAGSGDTCRVDLCNVVIDESNRLVVSTTQNGRIIITKKTLLYGDVTGNDQVTVVDAQQVLQYVVGALTLPDAACCPNFTVAVADVSGNGSITSYDAALIFQYSLGLLPGFPVETGTGRPFGKRSAVTVNKASLNIAVNSEVKDAIVYDLVGTKMDGFYAGEFALYCDAPAELIAKSTITTAVRGATLSSRYVAEDHLLRVAVSSNDDIDHDGPVAIVRITLPNAQQSTVNFSVKTALVNEGAIATDFNNGGLVGLLPAKTSLAGPAAGFRMTGSLLAIYRAAASSAATVTVWDLCGRMVARKVVKGTVATIDFNKFGKGAYIVRLNDGVSSVASRVVLLGR